MLDAVETLFLMLGFCFVSGHDFSRAVKEEKRIGFSPCWGTSGLKHFVRREFQVEKSPEAKQAIPYSDLNGNKSRVPHISLVFREMWDTTDLDLKR
jgi:hypothetical protein